MKTQKVWSIKVWNGGACHDHKYWVSSESVAKEWLSQNKYDFIEEVEITIFDSIEEIDEVNNETLRKKALAKLTDAERKALGL